MDHSAPCEALAYAARPELSQFLQGQEMADMEMQTDFRAGSPCRQAATEIMEDISMETGMDDELYRRDMINVFPGHPALPQQTHNLQGQRIMNPPQQPGAPGATIIGNHGPDTDLAMFQGPTVPQVSLRGPPLFHLCCEALTFHGKQSPCQN